MNGVVKSFWFQVNGVVLWRIVLVLLVWDVICKHAEGGCGGILFFTWSLVQVSRVVVFYGAFFFTWSLVHMCILDDDDISLLAGFIGHNKILRQC